MPLSNLGLDHHNNSHYFLLPLFGLDKFPTIKKYYVNTYIGDKGRKIFVENSICMLFAFEQLISEDFERVDNYLGNNPNFRFSYHAGSNDGKDLVMFVLKCPSKNVDDYTKIIAGKYSQTSTDYRQSYREFPYQALNAPGKVHRDNQGIVDFIDGITFQKPSFRKVMEDFLGCKISGELWNVFETEREVFRT